MVDISRHRELIDTEKFNHRVTVVGAGATGSFVVLALAKLGIKDIEVYDFDIVEEHNIANQLYSIHDIGKKKVVALQEIVKHNTGINITVLDERFVNQRVEGYFCVMVDSMASRKEIFLNSIKLKTSVVLAVEPRMGLDMMRLYNIEPLNVASHKAYEDTLYGDDVAEVSACGSSMSVITSSILVASYVVRQIINHFNEVPLHNEILLDLKFNNLFANEF